MFEPKRKEGGVNYTRTSFTLKKKLRWQILLFCWPWISIYLS